RRGVRAGGAAGRAAGSGGPGGHPARLAAPPLPPPWRAAAASRSPSANPAPAQAARQGCSDSSETRKNNSCGYMQPISTYVVTISQLDLEQYSIISSSICTSSGLLMYVK
ncbi:Protein of unknown function, partial [Gryllus bimaculatus]